jgi:hypothetical protein
MVVLKAQVPKAFSDSFKSRAFGLIPERIVGVSPIDNFTEQYQRRVAIKVVLFQDGFERALFAVVSQFDAFYVEGGGAKPLGFVCDFFSWDEVKFSVFIHELPDEPGACHAIYFNSFSSDPFHGS